MHLIAIGRMRNCPEAALFDRYNARLRPPLTLVELAEERGDPVSIKRKEAALMLDALPRNPLVVALDPAGRPWSSELFAQRLSQWIESSRAICFLIGGAEGLDASMISRADQVLSMGAMTWPHLLARVMLTEQLYRAQTIRQGHPYHRASQPAG